MHARAAFSVSAAAFSAAANRISTPSLRRTAPPQHRAPRPVSAMASSVGLVGEVFFLDEFAMRQWDDPAYGGTRVAFDKADFVTRIHAAHASGSHPLVDGYAPFCKHVFVPNFIPGLKVGAIEITDANAALLRSGYSARSAAELPVLTRWFPADQVAIPDAAFLDVILYSRDQLVLERSTMASKEERPPAPLPHAPWGIISVKGQDVVGRHTIPLNQRFLRSVPSGDLASNTRTLCQIHLVINPCYLS